jgi:hypothetical protein
MFFARLYVGGGDLPHKFKTLDHMISLSEWRLDP